VAALNYARTNLPQTGLLPAPLKSAGKPAAGMIANPPSGTWQQIGPRPINPAFNNAKQSGRVPAVAVDKNTSGANTVIYAGAANGGVWKSSNNGVNWTPTGDTQDVMAIGAVAIDPNNSQIVYAGTGESNQSADSYRGSGVLKSTNGGTTWTLYGTSLFGTRGSWISRVVIDPNNSNNVFASSSLGLMRSTDGGVTWAKLTAGLPNSGTFNAWDVVMDGSSNPAKLYVAARNFGVYKSTDGGANWSQLTTGLPAASVFNTRTRMAIAPSNANVLYMVITNSSGLTYSGSYNGAYYTTDGGANWSSMAAHNQDIGGGQGWYDLNIIVDPLDDNKVFMAGIDLWVATNARGTSATGNFHNVTNSYSGTTNTHPDTHGLAFGACTVAPCRIYIGNDGGVFYSDNPGTVSGSATWINLNEELAISEYTGGDIGPNYAATILALGGTQDNGTLRLNTTGTDDWTMVFGGDGGFALINWQNPDYMFGQYQNGVVRRSTNGGTSWSTVYNPGGTLFYAPITMDRTSPNHLAFGGSVVHESINDGATWYTASASFSTTVSALAIAPSNSAVIYAGLSNGQIHRTTNGNSGGVATYSNITPSGSTIWVTSIWVSPTDSNTAYASMGRFYQSGNGYLYKTTNGGASWASIMGNLPNLPVQSIIGYQSTSGYVLLVGNDIGVFYSQDEGVNWTWLNSGFPNTAVTQLALDPANTTLIAYTHGRSAFKLDLPQGTPPTNTPGPSPTPTATRTPTATPLPSYICTGQLSVTDATFGRPNVGNPPTTLASGDGNNVYYDTLTFSPTVSGTYTITMTDSSLDGFYVLYSPSFNPASPLTNALQAVDDVNDLLPQITRSLTAGTNYVLVTTSYDNLATGAYANRFTPNTINASCGGGATSTPTMTPTLTPPAPRPDTVGVYSSGTWYLRNTNTTGGADITASFGGDPADLPVVGDWNGDGVDTIGVYRNTTGVFFLSNSNVSPSVAYSFVFGNPNDQPFAGKWAADMTGDGVGVYRDSNGILYQAKNLSTGFSDYFAVFGNPGDQPIAGDWNNNSYSSIGIYRSSNTTWYMTNNSTPSGITFSDVSFVWNIGTNRLVAGDWDADGITTVGHYTTAGQFTLHSTLAAAGSDNIFSFGPGNAYRPVAGKWTLGSSTVGVVGVGVSIPPNPGYTDGSDGGAD
jgi:hypothetical protein